MLDGRPGPARDIVLLNAAAALYAADVAPSISEGLAHARTALDSGAARARLTQFVETTQRLGSTKKTSA